MMSYDMVCDVILVTYDVIDLVTYDVIDISVIIQLAKCRPPSPWVDMTSHTMSYDIIAHGM